MWNSLNESNFPHVLTPIGPQLASLQKAIEKVQNFGGWDPGNPALRRRRTGDERPDAINNLISRLVLQFKCDLQDEFEAHGEGGLLSSEVLSSKPSK
jgi:hypothetical protein